MSNGDVYLSVISSNSQILQHLLGDYCTAPTPSHSLWLNLKSQSQQ